MTWAIVKQKPEQYNAESMKLFTRLMFANHDAAFELFPKSSNGALDLDKMRELFGTYVVIGKTRAHAFVDISTNGSFTKPASMLCSSKVAWWNPSRH